MSGGFINKGCKAELTVGVSNVRTNRRNVEKLKFSKIVRK